MDKSHDRSTEDPGVKPGSSGSQPKKKEVGRDKAEYHFGKEEKKSTIQIKYDSKQKTLHFCSKTENPDSHGTGKNTKRRSGADPLAAQAESDWDYLSKNLEALAAIDRRAAEEQLIRSWDRDVIHELRRDRGILEMGVAFLDYMEREAAGEETTEELLRGADATLGYMVYDVGKLVKKREKLTEALNELEAKVSSENAQTVLHRLGAADPSEALREYKAAARKPRDAARRQRVDAALTSVLNANKKAASYVRGALKNEKNHKALTLEDVEAERIFPALRELLEEERFAALKEGGLSAEELKDSLAAWAGEIEEKLIKIYYNNEGPEV